MDIIKNNIWLALIKTCAYSSSFLGWLTMSTSTEREEYKIFSQSLGCVCQTIWMVAQNSRSLFHAEILACKEILVHHIITIIIFSFFQRNHLVRLDSIEFFLFPLFKSPAFNKRRCYIVAARAPIFLKSGLVGFY